MGDQLVVTTSYRSAWAWVDVLTEEQHKDIANPAALLRILPHAPGAHSTEFPSVTVQTVSRPASAGQHQEDTGSNQHEGVTRRGAAARHPHARSSEAGECGGCQWHGVPAQPQPDQPRQTPVFSRAGSGGRAGEALHGGG